MYGYIVVNLGSEFLSNLIINLATKDNKLMENFIKITNLTDLPIKLSLFLEFHKFLDWDLINDLSS